MANNPALSIIVPIYNVERWLPACIESILLQTYTDWELILVDDGSPDSCGQICDEYSIKDSRIKVIHQQNGGQSVARNHGLDISKGKYITFVDPDDYVVDQYTYSDNIKKMDEDPSIDMLVYPYIFPYCESSAGGSRFSGPVGYISDKESLFASFISPGSKAQPLINHAVWNKIFRREIFDTLRFPEGKIFEDTYVVPDIINLSRIVYCSEDGGYGYRVIQNSTMTSLYSYKKYHDRIIAYSRLLMYSMRYKSLLPSCYRIYSDIFFYYLGMVHSYVQEQYDKELMSYVDYCASLSFSWRLVLLQSETLKRKLYLSVLKILGYKKFIGLLLKYRR